MGVFRAVAAVFTVGALCALADEPKEELFPEKEQEKGDASSDAPQDAEDLQAELLNEVVAVSVSELLKALEESVAETQKNLAQEKSLDSQGNATEPTSASAFAFLQQLHDMEIPTQEQQDEINNEEEESQESPFDVFSVAHADDEESIEVQENEAAEGESAGPATLVSASTSDTPSAQTSTTESLDHYYPSASKDESIIRPIGVVVGSASMQTESQKDPEHQEDAGAAIPKGLRGSEAPLSGITPANEQTSDSDKAAESWRMQQQQPKAPVAHEETSGSAGNLGAHTSEMVFQSGSGPSSASSPALSNHATVFITLLSVATAGALAAF